MSDNSRALVPVDQRGVFVAVTRQITITEKLLTRIHSTATKWLNKAFELKGGRNWGRLLNHAVNWTEAFPESANAWYYLGYAYGQLSRYAKAIEAYQKALQIDPAYDKNCRNAGTLASADNVDKAIQAYQQAISINADFYHAWSGLGHFYGDLGLTVKAIEAYQQVARKQSMDWDKRFASIKQRNSYVKSIELCQRAIRSIPESADAWTDIGHAYSESDRYDKAIEAYQQSVRIAPNNDYVWQFLGSAYSKSGQYDKAIEAYQHMSL